MATFKPIVLPSNKKKDGTYNVKIRVTHKRQSRYLPTPFYVTQSQLTRSFKLKDALVIEQVESEIKRMRERVYRIGFIADSLDLEQLIMRINTNESSVSFTDYMQRKIDEIREKGRNKTADSYQTALRALLLYNGDNPLMFDQMTKSYILNYYRNLLSNHETTTANNYIKDIKIFYNMARKELNDEEADIVIVKYRCFDALEFEKPDETKPRAFERVEDMQAVIDCDYSNVWIYDFSKDMFILSFICLGINPVDLFFLKKENYKDGIITYRRKKIERRTREKSEIKIRVPEAGKIIIDKYDGDAEFLIDFQGHIRSTNICRYIHYTFQRCGIENTDDKNGVHRSQYVFYSARHSMATFARNICKIDKETVHEMLNHTTSKEFAITDVYIRKDYSHIWEANDKLIALFDWSFYIKQKKVTN